MHSVKIIVQLGILVAAASGPGENRRLSCAMSAAHSQHPFLVHLANHEQGSVADSEPEPSIVNTGGAPGAAL